MWFFKKKSRELYNQVLQRSEELGHTTTCSFLKMLSDDTIIRVTNFCDNSSKNISIIADYVEREWDDTMHRSDICNLLFIEYATALKELEEGAEGEEIESAWYVYCKALARCYCMWKFGRLQDERGSMVEGYSELFWREFTPNTPPQKIANTLLLFFSMENI